jgi:tRNA threonylcarbamoyladenosine modification (KEOPS) complex Cgi121 subunit
MVVISGTRHRITNTDTVLDRIDKLRKSLGTEIQILDANMIFGREHLEVAIEKTERAFSEGRNLSSNKATELLLYAGAETQISKAIVKMGIKEGLEEIAVIAFGDIPVERIMDELGWSQDDSVLEADVENLKRFGIVTDDMQDNITDLVLEKMALSELGR